MKYWRAALIVMLAGVAVACSSGDKQATRTIALKVGPSAADAQLIVPAGAKKPPVVVMMSGSGPHDMDETIGPNAPFRDLAVGLAAKGVASLRYAKTNASALFNPNFTVVDEYQSDALAAFELLAKRTDVDSNRIYLLGHSLGGTVAPRVATAEPRFAGVILLAASCEDLGDATLRQMQYMRSIGALPNADAQIAAGTAFVREIHAPGLRADTRIASPLAGGATGAYFLDLRSYDPLATAKALAKPLLLLQGDRDYQVTVTDDFNRWVDALAGRSDVTTHRYANANHLFIDGTGPASPAEYQIAGHVNAQVIADIAAWLKAR